MNGLEKLHTMRSQCNNQQTSGIDDNTLEYFLKKDSRLQEACDLAFSLFQHYQKNYPELCKLGEKELVSSLQTDYVNFYPAETINPYVPIAAKGPWIISLSGAVIHDSGGYGMIGMGHAPEKVAKALSEHHVMANIMTASFMQYEFSKKLKTEIGHTRKEGCPFDRFICLNSGSESVTIACRISDAHSKKLGTAKKIKMLAIKGGFHGRTDRPAQASDSSATAYTNSLASFKNLNVLDTIQMNNIEELEKAFSPENLSNTHYEMFLMEPVMGEGDPGKALDPHFYKRARELCDKNDTFLLVDSIQAGIRSHGVLSVVDYPGFTGLKAPDMETYSKALNAGQYPLSVLAMSKKAADAYVKGIYGNTMTTNPKALAVGLAVLNSLTDELRENIIRRGSEFLEKFCELQKKYPKIVTKVQGTGLLFSIEIAKGIDVVSATGLERKLRERGIGVIHGGVNSLRFTPVFDITSKEVDLVVSSLDALFSEL